MRNWQRYGGAIAVLGLAFAAPLASAQDTLKLAAGQRGNWDTSVSEVGQRAASSEARARAGDSVDAGRGRDAAGGDFG
jgi:hypothetical protein